MKDGARPPASFSFRFPQPWLSAAMPFPRVVAPEILDSLPAHDPDAVAARRDLRLINALMGNHRFVRRALAAHDPRHGTVLELGAGDGSLCRHLLAKFPALSGRLAALDLAPAPADWPRHAASWHQCDLFSPAGRTVVERATVVLANLFLHHFDAAPLARLGSLLGGARVLIFAEPARRSRHLWQGALLAVLARQNRVTRHDLPASVRAGFLRGELPAMLGLSSTSWTLRDSLTPLGAYRLTAVRNA